MDRKRSIVKDFSITKENPYDSDKPGFYMEAMVVFNRDGKLYETPVRVSYETEDALIAITTFFEHCEKTYHLWKVNPDREIERDLKGKVIGETSLVIEDESMTREEYEQGA